MNSYQIKYLDIMRSMCKLNSVHSFCASSIIMIIIL